MKLNNTNIMIYQYMYYKYTDICTDNTDKYINI